MSKKVTIETVQFEGDQPITYKCLNCPEGIEINEFSGEMTADVDKVENLGHVELDVTATDAFGRESYPMTIKKNLKNQSVMREIKETIDSIAITFGGCGCDGHQGWEVEGENILPSPVSLTAGGCEKEFEYKKFEEININNKFELKKISEDETTVIWQSTEDEAGINLVETDGVAHVAYKECDYHNEEMCSAGGVSLEKLILDTTTNPEDPYLTPVCKCVEGDIFVKLTDTPEEESFLLEIYFNEGEIFFWKGWVSDPIKMIPNPPEPMANANTIINLTNISDLNPKRVGINGTVSIDWEYCGCEECETPPPCEDGAII